MLYKLAFAKNVRQKIIRNLTQLIFNHFFSSGKLIPFEFNLILLEKRDEFEGFLVYFHHFKKS